MRKVSKKWKELKQFQSSTFDTIARRRLVEDQDTILGLSVRIQELQNEIDCMSDSKEFQDAESIRSGISHVTRRPVSFPPHRIPEGMLSLSVECRAAEKGRQAFGTHMEYRETFVNPDASSSAPYPQELNQWSSSIEEPLNSSTVEKSEKQTQDQDLRCQSGPSARRFSHLQWEETLQRIMVQTNNDCRFWIFTLTSSLHQLRLLAGR